MMKTFYIGLSWQQPQREGCQLSAPEGYVCGKLQGRFIQGAS